MKRVNVVSVQLVREKSLAYETNVVKCPQDASEIAQKFLEGTDREHFVVMCLDTKNKVNAINTVSIGSLNSCPVHPREVFKAAILSNSSSVILIHNHPSGDPTPSREDSEVTKRLAEAGKIMGIEVFDHVVVGENGRYVSLKEKGVL